MLKKSLSGIYIMMSKKLNRKFFARSTLKVAKELLGKVIVRKIGRKEIRGRILETEAYIGEEDRACHARFGRTNRNEVMYGQPGRAYIYLCYGIHDLLNVVTEKELVFGSTPKTPAAVLIRKIEPLSGPDSNLKSYGPGNLTKYLCITRELNAEDITQSRHLWLEDDGYAARKIKHAERVGVHYAGPHARRKWRFVLG